MCRLKLSLNQDEPLITYQLRVNNSSGNRDTSWDFEIDKYYSLTPEEALKKHSVELLEKFNAKEE